MQPSQPIHRCTTNNRCRNFIGNIGCGVINHTHTHTPSGMGLNLARERVFRPVASGGDRRVRISFGVALQLMAIIYIKHGQLVQSCAASGCSAQTATLAARINILGARALVLTRYLAPSHTLSHSFTLSPVCTRRRINTVGHTHAHTSAHARNECILNGTFQYARTTGHNDGARRSNKLRTRKHFQPLHNLSIQECCV